jgi:hypothetical protein
MGITTEISYSIPRYAIATEDLREWKFLPEEASASDVDALRSSGRVVFDLSNFLYMDGVEENLSYELSRLRESS